MCRSERFRLIETGGARALELPYRGDRLSLVVVLPQKGKSLSELEARLESEEFDRWTSGGSPTKVFVSLPRFNNCVD